MSSYDVVIVGAGPNGLAAANAFVDAGLSTRVVEAHATAGGGARTEALTLPGFAHDVCSAVHPLGRASPWFRALDLEAYGLSWIDPPAPLAHVLGDGRAVMLERSLDATCEQLGADGSAYRRLLEPFVEAYAALLPMVLAPLRFPSEPTLLARFGLEALRSMRGLARGWFDGADAPALLAGISAHGMVPLERATTAAIALVLGAAGHAVGWPIARGGSQAITAALVARFRARGGELVTGERVTSLAQLPRASAYVLDVTPRQLVAIAGDRLSARYRARLAKFRYGPGVYKIDWALRAPVPWRDPRCARAATVHLGGTLEELAAGERAVQEGRIEARPFVLVVQPTLFDPTRAPAGQHVAWAYCHVPHGSDADATAIIESQLEAAAPGFREVVLARASRGPAQLEAYNANYVGGDINGGLADARQLLFRPLMKRDPYATSAPDIFVCSSSTPPGGGVHGMCGYWAAASVLANVFQRVVPPLA